MCERPGSGVEQISDAGLLKVTIGWRLEYIDSNVSALAWIGSVTVRCCGVGWNDYLPATGCRDCSFA